MTTNQQHEIQNKVRKFIDDQKRTVNEQWKTVSRRVETETKTWEKWLEGNGWLKTAQKWQKELQRRAEAVRTEAYHMAGLATTHDLTELQRKMTTLNKKIAD
ncbi:MAG: hypothetical protein HY903_00485 [Deltaproteobacteria bacterium]|nr:hypothetical protein [Deltaproteobacteria bacterium]